MEPQSPHQPAGGPQKADPPSADRAATENLAKALDEVDMNNPTPETEEKPSGGLLSRISSIGWFLLAPVIAILLATFVVQSYQVDGVSMETTLQNNDRLIVDKVPRTWARITGHSYIPKRGNIIIFNQGGLDFSSGGTKQLIKRVVGLPGERVVVANNALTVYNQQHPEGFDPDTAGIYHIRDIPTGGSVDVTLGPHEIFVCGDNRPNSEDSRYFGPVNVSNIVGKLSYRILPVGKFEGF